MANPAPTLNQINAFNATIGTTIDFNIIGGTEVIRSNRIYIYDLSDNSLICTHLYVSTESIHELPPNTSTSIVYESGKSSADFTNNTQYYAQIQTYTDTNGTQGASGLSVAKLFWCLPTPTLTLATIPTTISTTSYNVSATYTPNTSGGATNEVQEFQFNLYSAIGTLLQTSGVVLYGEGVELSYNFSGLEVNSTYYVTLDVTTTQGMNVSVQSDTFTVSIDTPTMGSASVVNNGCDGYISVTSNLSSEYSHEQSVDAGEVMSFTTESPNDIKELQVDFHPIQDGTPWMSSTPDTTPYLFRASPNMGHSYNSESDTIVGGTVAWNQLVAIPANNVSKTENNVTITDNRDGSISALTTSDGASANTYSLFNNNKPVKKDHIYLYCGTPSGGSSSTYRSYAISGGTIEAKVDYGGGVLQKGLADGTCTIVAPYISSGAVITNAIKFVPQFIDLTAMFGTTIADYIYSLEQSSTGAGVAWFRKLFPEEYYPYSANTLQSVQATAHKTYDSGGNVIGNYALDSSVTLRGIPKLDASNNLYYDGDTYESDGTVTRKYGVVDLGTLNWEYDSGLVRFFTTAPSNTPIGIPRGLEDVICGKYWNAYGKQTAFNNNEIDKCFLFKSTFIGGTRMYIRDTTYTSVADFKTAVTGTTMVYPLQNPTAETAEPYTNPQIVDPSGTEEYVGSPIPVGHKTTYQRICPITGWTGCEVDVAGVNLCDNSVFGTWANVTEQSDGSYYVSNNNYTYNKIAWENTSNYSGQLRIVYHVKFSSVGTGTYPMVRYTDGTTTPIYPTATTNWQDLTFTTQSGKTVSRIIFSYGSAGVSTYFNLMISTDVTVSNYTPYNGTTYPVSWQTEAGTVYGGTVDLVSGVLTVTWGEDTKKWSDYIAEHAPSGNQFKRRTFQISNNAVSGADHSMTNCIATYNVGTPTTVPFYYVYDNYFYAWLPTETDADFDLQITYELATPITYQLDPHQIQTLVGQNNLWHDTNGEMTIMYQLPITDLLVKRKDMSQVGSQWLTLHSVPVEQASDMDFTYIDFLNQYGKKYQYALVPVLAQDQSGVIVQIEGGYTTSDTIDSIFDGVYIADQTNVERVKAGAGYGNIDMNQGVGSITPIGSKYPIVITNSQNQYHNGSIRGTIVPNDFYSNGNLSRIDMVNKRDELEQFLTNKRAKIIKDWNGKMWLVMIMSNVNCSFDDNYGMGMVSFSADWLEVGDPTNQQDLYNAGLINVGGV